MKKLYVRVRGQVSPNTYKLGRRLVTNKFKELQLNEAELKELKKEDKILEFKEIKNRKKKNKTEESK